MDRSQEWLASASSSAITFSNSMLGSISTTNDCPKSLTNVSSMFVDLVLDEMRMQVVSGRNQSQGGSESRCSEVVACQTKKGL